jgi:hypothetical protein
MSARRGDWISTYSGRPFYPLDPRPEDISIYDIAHALSQLCRFAGHTRVFYSVAQHSVLASTIVSPNRRLEALLHDAAEAYVVDVPRPLKRMLPAYRDIESRIDEVIRARFKLPRRPSVEIRIADEEMLATEGRDLMHNSHTWALREVPRVDLSITAWSPHVAETRFLTAFHELGGQA